MNMVNEKYPGINWIEDKKGELKKENYDACDSLVCVLAYINEKKYGKMDPKIISWDAVASTNSNELKINYTMDVWGKQITKKLILKEE